MIPYILLISFRVLHCRLWDCVPTASSVRSVQSVAHGRVYRIKYKSTSMSWDTRFVKIVSFERRAYAESRSEVRAYVEAHSSKSVLGALWDPQCWRFDSRSVIWMNTWVHSAARISFKYFVCKTQNRFNQICASCRYGTKVETHTRKPESLRWFWESQRSYAMPKMLQNQRRASCRKTKSFVFPLPFW